MPNTLFMPFGRIQPTELPAGLGIVLRSGGSGFQGGLNHLFLLQQGGAIAEVVEPVTRQFGKARLQSGRIIDITLWDVAR